MKGNPRHAPANKVLQVVETAVNVTNNSPSRDYSHPDGQTTQTTVLQQPSDDDSGDSITTLDLFPELCEEAVQSQEFQNSRVENQGWLRNTFKSTPEWLATSQWADMVNAWYKN